uniref:G-protein coupled receptors family 1 profile domain-containing protein n=1 Tax=Panagrolaimus sp. ES5 TaxID=591445 RepID=A0AC34GFI6_9BILA
MAETTLTKWQECFAANRSYPIAANRLFVGIPLLIGNTSAVAANATLLIILIRSWHILGSNKFNLLILHLAAAHCFYESINFISSIPALFASGPIYSNDFVQTATAFFNTPPATTVLWMNTLIALERFAYFIIPKLHVFMNRSYIRQALPLSLWELAHAMSIFSEIHGCKKRFNQWNMVYTFDCSYCNLTETLTILDLMTGMSQTLPIILVVCYVITFMQIFNIKFIKSSNDEMELRNTNAEIKVVSNYYCIILMQPSLIG